MSASIKWDTPDGISVPTSRPDALWKILVETFVPDKGEKEGDGDPYGVSSIEIRHSDMEKLSDLYYAGWVELSEPLDRLKSLTILWLHRYP